MIIHTPSYIVLFQCDDPYSLNQRLSIEIRWLDVLSSVRSCLLAGGNRSDLYLRKRRGFTVV